ncbi:mannose-6-phosphate isomerase, class I [Aeromicrobium sp. SMF47]|uniref:mannose-6-phosphate isomerase n=1 Tax=Aeromicrobium yanjiei TaxID=2662028 RepID=A0A5Q2MF78_9ACTN|nr:mannose-6-phosphate isomerase, class I [Aeromicrobium yanjiei]MRJ75176.1 mannose-6-phosphate isomerase, class I [Aeromicrobium yanjiei]QGG40369.1 mannose-6-phosphate isomerase, class I [Aeromicrobium yanjiei]
MYLLDNASRRYHWGSTSDIPQFLGESPDGSPLAEIWMGTHPLGPSTLDTPERVPLAEVSGELPFLFKILAADRPLSLQVHPSQAMAQAGYADEDSAGVPLDAPERTYRDPHHKPEMAYALTTFDTLVGFRPTAEILRVLHGIDTPLARSLGEDLRASPGFRGIIRLVERLLTEGIGADEITAVVEACRELVNAGIDVKRAYVTAVEIAEHYPEDVGVIISLTLNRLTLQPGEAAFLGAGIIHAHLKGMCLEIMAASDNVLRAGLTTKPLNPAGLVKCLERGMSRLARVTPEPFGFSTDIFNPDVREFALAVTQSSKAEPEGVLLPPAPHRIVVCTGGEVELVNGAGDHLKLARGDSMYAGPDDGDVRVLGTGEVAQAYTPDPDAPTAELVDLVLPGGERRVRRGRRMDGSGQAEQVDGPAT